MNRYPDKFLTAIIVVSVLVRLIAAFALGNEVVSLPGTADQVSYHHLALRVVSGHGFSFSENWWPMTSAGEPTAHWSFIYTGFLAAIYALVESPLAARLVQALTVGVLHPYLVFYIGKRAFGALTGVIAAGITALYTYFIYYAGTLMTEPIYIVAILGVMALVIRLAEENSPRGILRLSAALGLMLGVTVLLRQLFLLVVPVLFVWLWAARRADKRSALLRIGLVSIGMMVLLIAPFTLYNTARFGRFVLLNTNAGYAFYFANHPIHGTDFVPASEMQDYQSLVPSELRGLDEAALDQALLVRGLAFVVDQPARYLLLSLDRIPEYFKFWPSPDSGRISNIARVTSFGLTLPWMLAGIFIWLRSRPGGTFLKGLGTVGSLLLLFSLTYSAIHIFSWALIRYRLPVDAVLILFAGLAAETVYRKFHPAGRIDRESEQTGRLPFYRPSETK